MQYVRMLVNSAQCNDLEPLSFVLGCMSQTILMLIYVAVLKLL